MKNLLLLSVLLLGIIFIGCAKKEPPEKAPPEITKLIGILESGSIDEKCDAAKKLAEMKSGAKAAIPSLMRATKTRNLSIRISAQDALTAIGADSARAIMREPEIDTEMFMVLSAIGEPAVSVIVEELKATKSRSKISSIILVLSVMGEKAKSALPALEEMNKRYEQDLVLSMLLESTITSIKEGEVGIAKRTAKNEGEADRLKKEREETIVKVKALGKKIVTPRMSLDGQKESELTTKFGDNIDSIPDLAKVAESSGDIETRCSAIICLMKIGERGRTESLLVLPVLKKLTTNNDSAIKTFSAMAMVRLGDKETATPILTNILLKREEVTAEDITLMFAATLALAEGEIPVRDINAQVSLILLLESSKEPDAIAGIGIVLINSEVTHEAMVLKFAEMLNSDVTYERQIGAILLWKMESEAKPAYSQLRVAWTLEKDLETKEIMGMALIAVDYESNDEDNTIAGLGQDSLSRVLAFSKITELSPKGKRKALVKLVEMYNKSEGNARSSIISAICNASEGIDEAFPLLKSIFEQVMTEGNKENQFIITHALGKTGNAEAAPLLLEALKSNDSAVSNSAQVGLTNLGAKAATIVPQLVEMTKDIELQEDALYLIQKIGAPLNERDITVIAELMEVGSEDVQFKVASLLSHVGKPAIPELIKKLESNKKLVRRLAVGDLRDIAKKDNSTVEVIKLSLEAALAKEKDEAVQNAIKASLKEITN